MKLYRITTNKDVRFLNPIIPVKVLDSEDVTVPRISFSDSIDNCFKSVSWNRDYYEKWENNMFSDEEDAYIIVFELDTDGLKEGLIVSPKDAKFKYGVNDAEVLNEHWVIDIDNLKSKRYKILPTDISERSIIIINKNKDCFSCSCNECEDCVEELTRYSINDYVIKK